MPWDYFCPDCGAALVGSMADTEEEMNESMDKYRGKIIHCLMCGAYSSFDTLRMVEVIEGG